MCLEGVPTWFFRSENSCQPTIQIKSRHPNSKVRNTASLFFLTCTAISGMAFAVSGAAIALGCTFILGTITLACFFPDACTTNSVAVRNLRRASYPITSPPTYSFYHPFRQRPPVVEIHHHRSQPNGIPRVDPFERIPVGGDNDSPPTYDPHERIVVGGDNN